MEEILANSKVIYLESNMSSMAVLIFMGFFFMFFAGITISIVLGMDLMEDIGIAKLKKKTCFNKSIISRSIISFLVLIGSVSSMTFGVTESFKNQYKTYSYVLEANENVSNQQVSDYFIINSMGESKYNVTLREYNEDTVNALGEKYQAFIGIKS